MTELRHGLEETAAYLAAQRATDEDRAILRQRYAALAQADKARGEPLVDAETDLEFHLAIADASHNVALMHVMRGLFNLLRATIFRYRELIFNMSRAGCGQ